MIRLLGGKVRLFFSCIISLIKYGYAIGGWSVVIKNSQLLGKNIHIFEKTNITDSVLNNFVKVSKESIISSSELAGYNKIGSKCHIGNTTLGKFSYIADYGKVNNAVIGNFCSIGPNLKVGLGMHPVSHISTSPLFYSTGDIFNIKITEKQTFEEYKQTKIGNDVWIGANVFIKDGVSIGDGAILGAGSVVLKDIPDYAIVGGVPAKVIRMRHSNDVILKLKASKWWDKEIAWLKDNLHFFQKSNIEEDYTQLFNG